MARAPPPGQPSFGTWGDSRRIGGKGSAPSDTAAVGCVTVPRNTCVGGSTSPGTVHNTLEPAVVHRRPGTT